MSNFLPSISPQIAEFIREQPVFFVATAAGEGRINCSPKGGNTFRVLNEKTVAYLDLTGSGSETSAHVLADGRLTIMFCSFGAKPLILRLYGRGEVVREDEPKWAELIPHFMQLPGQRQIIVLHVESLQTSCGMAVPMMELVAPRNDLLNWAQKKGPEAMAEYRSKKNARSIDGLETGLVQATDASTAPKPKRKLIGLIKGQIKIADDFDAPLPEDVMREFEGPIEPSGTK